MHPIIVLIALWAMHGPAPDRCSVRELRTNPQGYIWPVERIRDFVREADVIARVRAVRLADPEELEALPFQPGSGVNFTVLEVLRGNSNVASLVLRGSFVDRDDYNRGSAPYRIVRPAGQRGSCFALEYRQNAEYLLILKTQRGTLTPYWAPLAPLNEQVRGPDDPWVTWVESTLAAPTPGDRG